MEVKELITIAREKAASFDPKGLENYGLIPRNGLYFPAIYYPPIPMYPKSDEGRMFQDLKYNADDPLAVYIHIPFCPSRCLYCHWVVRVGDLPECMDNYLKNLEKETDMYRKKLGLEYISPTSVLIGGGTPSILSPAQTERFLGFFAAKFDLSKCRQITCEVEPSTLLGNEGMEKLKIMKNYGVNRISLGVQSFDDGILNKIGRAHNSDGAKKAVQQIKLAGFQSLSIDLIYGLPGLTPEKWVETLNTAFSLDIDACQLYRLRIVPHGAKTGVIKEQFDKSPEIFPDLEQVYIMKELGILISSQSGFGQFSRRVFAKSAVHNSEYLKDHCDRLSNVLGLGISSWTNLGDRFFLNTGKSLEEYNYYIDQEKLPIARGKIKTQEDIKRWAFVLPLKHVGVLKTEYMGATGMSVNEAFGPKIEKLKKHGLLEENDFTVKLTERGSFFADEVCAQFYHADYLPFPKTAYTDGELNPYND